MLAITAGARQPFGQRQHRLHRYHHARFEHGIDVFAQFEAGFATVVMRQHAEGMPVTEGAILQQVELGEVAIDLIADSRAGGARLDQRQAEFVCADVGLPDFKRCGIGFADEQRALERGVVAGNHREGIQTEDVAGLEFTRGHRIMRAIGIDARLEPDPAVTNFTVRIGARNLELHRVATSHGDIDFARADPNRVANGFATDIGGSGTALDQFDFLGRLDHAQAHDVTIQVERLGAGHKFTHQLTRRQRHVITLDTNAARLRNDRFDRSPVIVTLPVGVNHVVAVAATPGLAQVDIGRHGNAALGRNHAGIGATERTVQKAGVVGDIVHRGQQHRIDIAAAHQLPQPAQAIFVFAVGKRQPGFFTILQFEELGTLRHDNHSEIFRVTASPGQQSGRTGSRYLLYRQRRHRCQRAAILSAT